MSIFEQVAFKAPNYSVYNLSHDNKSTYQIGEVIPVMQVDLAPGERLRVSVEQLTRFVPMLAPVMHNFRLYVDSVFVPYRILGEDYENAFNYAKPADVHPIPSRSFSSFVSHCHGRLLDYLNFPTFEKVRELILSALNNRIYPGTVAVGGYSTSPEAYLSDYLNWLSIPVNTTECWILIDSAFKARLSAAQEYTFESYLLLQGNYSVVYDYSGGSVMSEPDFSSDSVFVGYSSDLGGTRPSFRPFYGWLVMEKLPSLGVVDGDSLYKSLLSSGVDAFSEICSRFDLLPDALVGEYVDAVYNALMYDYENNVIVVEDQSEEYFVQHFIPLLYDSDIMVNCLEFKTYWKAIFDWYINTNIDGDGEDLYDQFLAWFNGDTEYREFPYNKPFTRRWESDYFTSCFPDGMVPAVPIPANPTIIDLRGANKMQKMDERTLYAGKRPQDQNLAHFGVVSSNARFDRTEVLSRRIFDIDINAVTQTNQSEFNKALKSPLGSYAGQGISVDLGQFLFDYTAEERGMIHVLVSVRPVSSYFQGLSKQATKTSRFDFLTPVLADVGEAIVKKRELYFDLGSSEDEVFGYNRQYAEYMYMPNETHGLFRNALRHWTGARFIDIGRANLNSSFIGVDPASDKDDINRIFASGAGDTILQYLYFHVSAARPLSRTISYSL